MGDEDAYVKPAAPGRGRGVAPIRGVTRGGKSVMIEDFPALPQKDDDDDTYEREPLKREKSMTEIKPERKPEFKREKSTPEFKTNRERDDRNRNNRNSREKDDESFQARRGRGRGDGYHGGRGREDQFGGRGGGRGGRGGYDGFDQPRGGGGGGGGSRGRGRGMEDRHHDGGIGNRRQNDQGVTVKSEDLSDDIAHMDLNKDNENSGGNRGA